MIISALLNFFSIKNLRLVLIIGLAVGVVFFYKSWEHRGIEMVRQQENLEQIRQFDSLKYATQNYNKEEIDQYLEYNRKDLQAFLREYDIKTRRIERIVTQTMKYRDTTKNEVDLSPILNAIRNNKQGATVAVKDSSDCLVVEGYVVYEGDSLKLNITSREFKNKSDIITYWQRKQWSFLGIKSRIFGKKKTTLIIKDACGNTETFVINSAKKK